MNNSRIILLDNYIKWNFIFYLIKRKINIILWTKIFCINMVNSKLYKFKNLIIIFFLKYNFQLRKLIINKKIIKKKTFNKIWHLCEKQNSLIYFKSLFY